MSEIKHGFPERLRRFINGTGLSRDLFAEKAGVKRAQIFRYLKGDQEPGLSFFQSIKNEFPWADIEWLATGVYQLCVREEMAPIYGEKPDGVVIIDEAECNIFPDMVTKHINQLLEAMTEEQKRDVLKYAEEKKLLAELKAERESIKEAL